MDAMIYRSGHDFHVRYSRHGLTLDEAGPFDDEADATFAAHRSGARIRWDDAYRPGKFNQGFFSRAKQAIGAS